MNAHKAAWVGATVGGAITAVVLVTVYEGSLEAASNGQARSVQAGEVVAMQEGRAPSVLATVRPAYAVPAPGAAQGDDGDERDDRAGVDATAGLGSEATVETLRAANDDLRAQVAQLRRALDEKTAPSRDDAVYDLDDELLEEMAQKCELRWDTPGVRGGTARTLSEEDAGELGFTAEERDAVNAALQEFNEQMLAQYRGLYTAATGDPNVGSMSPDAMFSEIVDKAGNDNLKAVFQRLSAERAGLRAPPEDPTALSPAEQLYRLAISSGDEFEIFLGEKIGTDKAAALRRLHHGFGSKHRSSYGCPER